MLAVKLKSNIGGQKNGWIVDAGSADTVEIFTAERKGMNKILA